MNSNGEAWCGSAVERFSAAMAKHGEAMSSEGIVPSAECGKGNAYFGQVA